MKKFLNILEIIIIITIFLFCLLAILQKTIFKESGILGFHTYTLENSFENIDLKKGDVILYKYKKINKIKKNDVIIFYDTDSSNNIILDKVNEVLTIKDEIVFNCKDNTTYQSQILGVLRYKFKIFSFLNRLFHIPIGFFAFIAILIGLFFAIEFKSANVVLKENNNKNNNIKNIGFLKNRNKNKNKSEKETKMLDNNFSMTSNIKTLDSYNEDYLENEDYDSLDDSQVFEEFKMAFNEKDKNENVNVNKKEEKVLDLDESPINEEDFLDETASIPVPVHISSGFSRKKANLNDVDVTNLKRKSRGYNVKEIDITSEVDNYSSGYDITDDIESELEKTKEYDFSNLKNLVDSKSSKNDLNNETKNKEEVFELPKKKK